MSPSASVPYDCKYYANGAVRNIAHPYHHGSRLVSLEECRRIRTANLGRQMSLDMFSNYKTI
jgi:hypothetical protein